MSKVVKLLCVTENNNNKYYDMEDLSDGNMKVTWGRVEGGTPQTTTYPIKKWDSLYNSKIKKGYRDMTHLYAIETKSTELSDISEKTIAKIIQKLQDYANNVVKANYSVSSSKVTKKMVDEAQLTIDQLSNLKTSFQETDPIDEQINSFNKVLLDLFRKLPRKMKKVQMFLLDENIIKKTFSEMLKEMETIVMREQDILDSLSSMVMIETSPQETKEEKITLLDKLGLEMRVADEFLIKQVKKMLGSISDKFVDCWYVINKKTQQRFDEHLEKAANKKIEKYWHGSRNANWFNILQTGLLIRPSGVATVGAMYGHGIYFADKALKSFGYCGTSSSYWTKGNDKTAFMAIMNVHVGKQLEVEKHNSECYRFSSEVLKKKGNYDSVWGKKGADLKNDEFIVFSPNNCTIHALVELKD